MFNNYVLLSFQVCTGHVIPIRYTVRTVLDGNRGKCIRNINVYFLNTFQNKYLENILNTALEH